MSEKIYDVIIVGGGPAGLSAGIYTCRGGLKTLLLEKLAPGGQAAITDRIENFPGFAQGISGPDFVLELEKQAKGFGLEIEDGEITEIAPDSKSQNPEFKIVKTADKEYRAQTVIISVGARPKRLGVGGEDKLIGRGVSYCATCDGPLFKGKDVVVIGGGDTAVGEALFLSRFCREVSVVHRRDKLRATKILQDRALAAKNVKVLWSSIVTDILGEKMVEGVRLKDVKTGQERVLDVAGVFVFVGLKPGTDFLEGLINTDDEGFIITDEDTRTNVKGIFACGDCRKKTLRQIVTACAEGALSGFMAIRFVEEIEKD